MAVSVLSGRNGRRPPRFRRDRPDIGSPLAQSLRGARCIAS
jgi:hypothetical protein